MIRLVIILALLPPCFCTEQALRLTGFAQSVSNTSVAAQPANGACRVEFYVNPSTNLSFSADTCGIQGSATSTFVNVFSNRPTGWTCCNPFPIAGVARVRYQMCPAGAGGDMRWEAWDITGVRIYHASLPYTGTSGSNSNGASVNGGSAVTTDWGFYRVFTTCVPLGNPPPLIWQEGDLLSWDFQGNLNDSSGNGYTGSGVSPASSCGSAPCYTTTIAGNPLVTPVICSDLCSALNATPSRSWYASHPNNGLSWDANGNFPSRLDGVNSYSDLTPTLTYSWSKSAGPSLTITSSSSVNTTVTGVQTTVNAAADYLIQLTVNDGTNMASAQQHIGAVPMDANGVVQIGTNATKIFGPIIAFGRNHWGYEDERNVAMIEQQALSTGSIQAYYNASVASWLTPGTGTVSYKFAGVGAGSGFTGTALSSGITATSTTIPISNASVLDLSVLPTWIIIGSVIGQQELVRVSATSATSGAANLTVAYDGRGISSYPFGNVNVQAANTWAMGTTVGQYKVTGTSTLFVTDTSRPVCPAGAPGPPGPVVYSTGTVTLTGSSATITGSGTTWNSGNGVIGGASMIRITATHAGGTPFVAWRQITTVGGTTSITVDHALPADVDVGPFSYAIIGARYLSLEGLDSGSNVFRELQNGMGCESETALYALAAHDIPTYSSSTFTGVHYTYKNSVGVTNQFGPNFYGSGMAAREFHLASGLTSALTLANKMDENWVNDPEVGNGWGLGVSPLLYGGGFIGAVADLALNTSTALVWPNVEQIGNGPAASAAVSGCNDYDTRDSGVLQGFVGLLGIFDPNNHSTWQSQLTFWHTRDITTVQAINGNTGCKENDNSFANGFYFNTGYPALHATHNSTTITSHVAGTFVAGMCNGVASGTLSVTNGSATATGSGIPSNAAIVLTGLDLMSNQYTMFTLYTGSGSSITLGALWPGMSGTVTYTVTSDQNWGSIASGNNDPLLTSNYVCTFNNTSQVTIQPAYAGSTDSTGNLHFYPANLSGYGAQTFMAAGYKESALRWGSLNPDATIAANNAALLPLVATWVHDVGYASDINTFNYGRVFQACEPALTISTALVQWKATGCQTGADPASIRSAAVLNGEGSNAFSQYYAANPGSTTYEDNAYCAVWGYAPYTDAGYCTNANYVRDENSDVSLGSFKWPGFFFGIGVGRQWPAIRVQTPASTSAALSIRGKVSIRGQIVIH